MDWVYFIDSFVFVRGFRGSESSLAKPTKKGAHYTKTAKVSCRTKTEKSG